MTDYAKAERAELCDLFDAVGPDHPTLDEGWTTYDLAVHLWMRESDPMAGARMMLKQVKPKMDDLKATTPYPNVVDHVRKGPPALSLFSVPKLGSAANLAEFAIHHEDVRRAVPDWTPRDLDAAEQDALWSQVKVFAAGAVRKTPVDLVLRRDGGQSWPVRDPLQGLLTRLGRVEPRPEVSVSGESLEFLMFLSGRARAAKVGFAGPADAVAELKKAPFGF